jgi:hypothetical protein
MPATKLPFVLAAAAALALVAPAPASAQAVSPAIKLDHFGYRPADAKVAIVTANPGATVQVRDAATLAVVFTVPTNGGSITPMGQDGPGSFDTVWWVDFSPFTAVGSYHLFSPALGGKSYDFVIRADAHRDAFRAALKSYYRQRCNTPKPAVHAGAWADPAACHAGDVSTAAAPGQTNHGLLDLRGGWHDAGDYNKYVWGDSGAALLFLLRAYQRTPAAFGDDLGIPESGNGIPDVLDEVRVELEWLLKMQRPDGSVLSQTHVDGFASASPPSADGNPRFYRDANPESDAVFVGAAALGSWIVRPAGMIGLSDRLRAAALLTWPRVLAQPTAGNEFKVWAAAELFRLDPTNLAARAVVDAYHPGSWAGVFLNVMSFDTAAALSYVQAQGANPVVVANMRTAIGEQVDYIFSEDDLYRNGMPDWSYYWGSNSIRAGYGVFLLEAARLGATGAQTPAAVYAHAADFLRFFHGQNPMRMVYLSNVHALGGEHSVWQMYHAWFGDSWSAYSRANHIGKPAALSEPGYPYFAGVDNHGVSDGNASLLGPAPGLLVGGPNKDYGGDSAPPLGALGYNRFYRDWCEQRQGAAPNTWEITENSIKYQAPYVFLASAFAAEALPVVLQLDPFATSASDGNSIFEPNETVLMVPSWQNHRPVPSSLAGALSGFTGPGAATYAIFDGAAAYGMPPWASVDCLLTSDCYQLAVSGPRPAVHWDASLLETLASGDRRQYTVHIGDSFADVPRASPYYRFVERMLHERVTGGCGGSAYCPLGGTTREQMAVFVLVAQEGDGYAPPPCTTPVFGDVPASSPYCRWIEELARRGVVSGCGGGAFCPGGVVSREQLAVFALATREGLGWAPPACATPPFSDVPVTSPYCRWIQELARRGVVSGCGGGNYCPTDPVTREQMGVFISLTFRLTLYAP